MSPFLPLVATVILSAAAAATGQEVREIAEPPTPIRIDLRTGEITPGAPPPGSAEDAVGTAFANVSLAGLYAIVPAGEEWVDFGVKSAALSGLVCTLELGYGTTAIDPSLGGPGASIEVALYEGTLGSCSPGDTSTEVVRLSFTGLPGTVDGSPAGYVVGVPLGSLSGFLADGPLGWGYVGLDAASGPLLVVVGADPTGTSDVLDAYQPAPATTGACTATFGLPVAGVSSFYLRLEEDDGSVTAAQSARAGSGVNPGVLGLGTSPPVVGSLWDPGITTDAVLAPQIDFLALSTVADPGTVVPGLGELLIGLLPPNPIASLLAVTPGGSPFAVPVATDSSLIGLALSVQAGQIDLVGGLLGLTNAIDIVVGF